MSDESQPLQLQPLQLPGEFLCLSCGSTYAISQEDWEIFAGPVDFKPQCHYGCGVAR
jgi:hypothetical protein